MTEPKLFILYVDDPGASASFYSDVLESQPVEKSPTFAMFVLGSGVRLGLWSKHTVQPPPVADCGGSELAFALDSDTAVAELHREWTGRGIRIAQPLVRLDFGLTFVALDPDGHRLRPFSPSIGPSETDTESHR